MKIKNLQSDKIELKFKKKPNISNSSEELKKR